MDKSKYPAFQPTTVLEIDHTAAEEWKKAGIAFGENNDWYWEGTAYLVEDYDDYDWFQVMSLESQLDKWGINLYDFANEVPAYYTRLFGFDDFTSNGEYGYSIPEMDPLILKICAKEMKDLGIKWCGLSKMAYFYLIASEAQLQELIKRLEKPQEYWKKNYSLKGWENGTDK